MSWRRKRSKGSFNNPVIGASVINTGGGGGDKPIRKKPLDAKANRQLSDAPACSRGWGTVRWEDMSPGQRDDFRRSISPGNVFVPASQRKQGDTTLLDMSDLDAERDRIMRPTRERVRNLKNIANSSHSLLRTNKRRDWRAEALAMHNQRKVTNS